MTGRAGLLPGGRTRGWRREAAARFAVSPAILPYALGAAAWLVILASSVPASPWRICTASVGERIGLSAILATTGQASLMLVAMMVPLLAAPVEHVVARSYQARQVRGALIFIVGYLAVWLMASLAALPLALAVQAGGLRVTRIAAAMGLLVAALWQLLPAKRLALRRCSRTAPLRQDGWRADLACARYGFDIARDCLTACWALMLMPLVAPGGWPGMILVQSIAMAERHQARPDFRASALGLAVWAGVTLLP